ncbi:hypothetical protein DID88_009779 [Monilinia fructigena]|uniref:AAA+ ATPase domain-containing protein n=1 Tax=Monilinia fructigena TaxID=38457 RepID=A0A395IL52_9HELO|nr:hypothetical protein DID88_009779 [Monilinia fructigena]
MLTDEDMKCPEILYKVQYKDMGGEIKGTKELAAPYKLKKTTYRDSEKPILEVLYSVTIWFPTIYSKKRGKKDKDDNNAVSPVQENETISMTIHGEKEAHHSFPTHHEGLENLMKNSFSLPKGTSDYKENCDDAEASHHINVLQKYLEDSFEDKLKFEDDRHARANPVATFDMLWMLFKPGMDVYAQFDEQRAGFVYFDGRFVGRRSHEVTIAPFEGEREITSLKVIPAHYIDRNPVISPRKQLEDRGEKFYSMLMGRQMDYRGFSMPVEQKPKRFHEGRVVVDQSAFYTYADWHETQKHPPPVLGIDDDESGIFTSYALVVSWALISSLKMASSRRGLLSTPKFHTSAIENLVLPNEKQELIKALVHKYTSSKKSWQERDDVVRRPYPQQRRRSNLLLHGPPGAGKTYTAECVAEFTSRPLLSLTCGDIGTDEVKVEESLSSWFKLAEIWGAVMLIDEADVYLERREVSELTRMARLCILTRDGILPRHPLPHHQPRVGHFDPASSAASTSTSATDPRRSGPQKNLAPILPQT